MKEIPDKSVDMVLVDLPYGTTACKWDEVIPMEPLWEAYNRVTKENGIMAFFASQPFTAILVTSNLENFRYEWIWEKQQGVDFMLANRRPLKKHEEILIFSKQKPRYFPQGLLPFGKAKSQKKNGKSGMIRINPNTAKPHIQKFTNYPTTLIKFNKDSSKLHATQKPVALLEYLIKTYTNEGETVLDNTMGSGSTGVACKNLNRKFIGIEKEPKYFEIAKNRIEGTLDLGTSG